MSWIPATIQVPRFEQDPLLLRSEVEENDFLLVHEDVVNEQHHLFQCEEEPKGDRFHHSSISESGNDIRFLSASSFAAVTDSTSLTQDSELDCSVIEDGGRWCDSEQTSITANQNVIYDQESLRTVLVNRLNRISYQERCLIEDEIHGVSSMGTIEDKMKPHIVEMSLKKFQEHLDRSVLQSQEARRYHEWMETPNSVQATNASHAYEPCVYQKLSHFVDANWNSDSYSSDLRIMCLRAELWDPQGACGRFLTLLNALYSFYGEDGLQRPPTLVDLNHRTRISPEEFPSGVPQDVNSENMSWKKMKRVSKRKRNCDNRHNSINMPEMQCIKSGMFQLLPSRDRAGRRVVVLQSETESPFNIKTMFKAMLYFFSKIALCDIDAQRDGLVCIVSIAPNREGSEVGDDQKPTCAYNHNVQQFVNDCINFQKALPIRCSAIHVCYDASKHPMLTTQLGVRLLKSMSEDSSTMSVMTRIRLYDNDLSNTEVRNKLATFGIPVRELPVTPTGVIKHKQHNQWIKTQEWFERQDNQVQQEHMSSLWDRSYIFNGQPCLSPFFANQVQVPQISATKSSKRLKGAEHNNKPMHDLFTRAGNRTNCGAGNSNHCSVTLIECPRVNDVLFRQGGKFWNDQHKFQRGNLEFMELIDAKVTLYQKTRSWKKKREIILGVIQEFAATWKEGRFLESASQLKGIGIGLGIDAPEGCWVELPLNSPMLHQKVRNSFINHVRRVENRERQNQFWTVQKRQTGRSYNNNNNSSNNNNNNNLVLPTPEPTRDISLTTKGQAGLQQAKRTRTRPREETPRTTPIENPPNHVPLIPAINGNDEHTLAVVNAIAFEDDKLNKHVDEFCLV